MSTAALIDREVSGPEAQLIAEAASAVFNVAAQRWLAQHRPAESLLDILAAVPFELRALN